MFRRWALILIVGAAIGALWAQPGPPPRAFPRAGAKVGPGGRGRGFPPPARKAARAAARQNLVDYLMSLSPEQQQQFMRNSPRFRNLPPRQQEMVQQRLEEFNGLPVVRREALRERYELFRQLAPEQQERARFLYRQWLAHAPERRQEMMREFRQLRDASPGERGRRIESEEFRARYSDREQETLRGLVELIPQDN